MTTTMTKEQKRLATLLKLSRRSMTEEDFKKVVEMSGKPRRKGGPGRKPLQLSPGDEKKIKLNAKLGYVNITHVAKFLEVESIGGKEPYLDKYIRVVYDIDGSGNRKITLTSPDNLSIPTWLRNKYR
jgi:hypothetical protein